MSSEQNKENKSSERSVYEALTDWNHLIQNQSMGYPIMISSRKTKSKNNWDFWDKIKSWFGFKKKVSIEVRETDHSWVETHESNSFPSLLPIAQRITAQTIAFDLVSVQPLSLPKGLLFYMDTQPEREDVYTRVVLIEKYKLRKRNPEWLYQSYDFVTYPAMTAATISAPITITSTQEMKDVFGEPNKYDFSK
jgi:hypothetical protein